METQYQGLLQRLKQLFGQLCMGQSVWCCVSMCAVCVAKALAPLFMLCCVWVSRALD